MMKFTPDLLTFENGQPLRTAADWEFRRKELVKLICEEEFGYMPPAPKQVIGKVLSTDRKSLAGLAVKENIEISFDAQKGRFSFPLRLYLPTDAGKAPFGLIVHFGADKDGPSFPAEMLLGNGFAVATMDNKDISGDDGDFTSGLAGYYTRTGRGDEWGKLAIWMFGLCRALDYLLTRDEIDPERTAVCGHSRMGKATLYAGALDERIKFVFSTNAGCGGDAMEQTKHEGAETVAFMNERFPYWFCENRKKYSTIPIWEKYDQHFLVGAIAPRYVAIAAAEQDRWADPYSEQLTAVAASPAWEFLGRKGYIGPEEPIGCGECYNDGSVSYHLRAGGHALTEVDWTYYVEFMKKHS